MMQSPSPCLLARIRVPRTLAWLLIALTFLYAWHETGCGEYLATGGTCLLFPAALNYLLQYPGGNRLVRYSLLLDSAIAGLVIGFLDYGIAEMLVLLTMLVVSVLIIGGIRLTLLMFGAACLFSLAGYAGRPGCIVDLAVPMLLALSAYVSLLGLLVYLETSRLYAVHQHESAVRDQLELLRQRIVPHVAPQVFRWEMAEARRKRLTVFFSDIEGFTRVMDTSDESRVADWLNEYFSAMTGIVETHEGTVDKFLGDGLMVLFGDMKSGGPVADAYACVSMALEMKSRLAELSSRLPGGRVRVRIGIHTGYCLVGSFGAGERLDYTALGSTVNLASRIEGAASGDEILISAETYRLLKPWVQVEARGWKKLKGISSAVFLYSVIGLACPGNGRYLSGRVQLLSTPAD